MDTSEYASAVEQLTSAAASYYGDGDILMSDAAFDELMRDVARFESTHDVPDPISTKVAAGALQSTGNSVRHDPAMLSLDNVYDLGAFRSWVAGLERALGKPATLVVEPKLDGMAVAIRYRNGSPVQMVTRGDGNEGEDVTAALADVVNLPGRQGDPVVTLFGGNFEVRGEVVFTSDQFEDANAIRERHRKPLFANARNGVAGTVRSAVGHRDYRIPVSFYAYDLTGTDSASHCDSMADLADAGFGTARGLLGSPGPTDLAGAIAEIEAGEWDSGGRTPSRDVECDGMVIKLDLPGDRATLGAGSKSPRWATAYKFPSTEVTSVLEEVTWAVGRTGVIAPRARIQPVKVGGTTVEFATLHNPKDIARKGFLIGDTVLVRRAGEVIPRLEAPLPALRNGSQRPIQIPSLCPQCGGPIDSSDARLRCRRGTGCGILAGLIYAVARDALDIEGVSTAIVTKLVENEAWVDVASIFEVGTNASLLIADGGVAPANAPKIVVQIEAAKTIGFARVLTALGIVGTGRSMSRRLAAHFGSMDALLDASVAALAAVDGIGEVKAQSIHDQLADPAMRNVIDRMAAAGVQLGQAADDTTQGGDAAPLAGQAVCVTGSMVGPLAGLSRNEVNELIEKAGGRAASSVSKATSLLVAGAKAGSKLAKAESLGVTVVSEDQFASMIGLG